jgi:aminoglycoside 3-N-acetyltransferase
MTEADAVNRAGDRPATVASLATDLAALGVARGMTLLVHSSLSRLGWVCGGAQAVVLALQEAIGEDGTLVMPTHSDDLSEPSRWRNPPVPESWWATIRATMPAYDPDLTPSRRMGAIPECFRNGRSTLRSAHPADSFAARGRHAARVTDGHALDYSLGESSPLARVYDLDGWTLLLGVGHGNNTSLHLAETRAAFPGKRTIRQGSPVLLDGERRWVEYDTLDWNDEDFPVLGADFARDAGLVRTGRVAAGEATLMPQRALVDYGVGWIERHRGEARQ